MKAKTFLPTAKALVLLLLQGCYNIKEIAMQFLTDRTLKRSCQQSKSVILNLLQGCYNIPYEKSRNKTVL